MPTPELHDLEAELRSSVQDIEKYGVAYARWKSTSWKRQEEKKITKSLLMKSHESQTVAAQEREAYISDQYRKIVDLCAEAIYHEHVFWAKRENAYARYEATRSLISLSKKQWEAT